MKKQLILVGGGGHCKSCIDVIEAQGIYIIAGILDLPEKKGSSVLGYPVLGTDDDLERFVEQGYLFLVTVGQIKSAALKKQLFEKLTRLNAVLPEIVSPMAYVSAHARLGAGTIVMHGAVVNAGALIGNNVIINTGALIEHDVEVADHVHVSTKAVLNGAAAVAAETFIGSNTVVSNGVAIGAAIVIGAGSTVTDNLTEPGVYMGSPAKKRIK